MSSKSVADGKNMRHPAIWMSAILNRIQFHIVRMKSEEAGRHALMRAMLAKPPSQQHAPLRLLPTYPNIPMRATNLARANV